jgi:MYXO-CTERM domain-containing protein
MAVCRQTSFRALCAIAFSCAVSLLPVAARADAIGPPPTDCPPGSTPESSHAGSYCAPAVCDPSCPAGESCAPVRLCVVRDTYRSRGGNDHMFVAVAGACDTSGSCAKGTCETLQVCAKDAKPKRGCGCEAAGAGHGSIAALGWLALLGVLGVRIRSRR